GTGELPRRKVPRPADLRDRAVDPQEVLRGCRELADRAAVTGRNVELGDQVEPPLKRARPAGQTDFVQQRGGLGAGHDVARPGVRGRGGDAGQDAAKQEDAGRWESHGGWPEVWPGYGRIPWIGIPRPGLTSLRSFGVPPPRRRPPCQ